MEAEHRASDLHGHICITNMMTIVIASFEERLMRIDDWVHTSEKWYQNFVEVSALDIDIKAFTAPRDFLAFLWFDIMVKYSHSLLIHYVKPVAPVVTLGGL